MAYKMGESKRQQYFLPAHLEDYVGAQDPVRIYDAFVDALNFSKLGIHMIPKKGAEQYSPKCMLKLLVYSYSYGIYSSRQIERACHHNLSFKWLTGDQKPDYRTIARFRSQHKEALTKVLEQCVTMCVEMDLIDGMTLFTDGSKIRANASIGKTKTKETIKQDIEKIKEQVKALIEESEKIDKLENNEESLVTAKKEINSKEQLVEKMKEKLQTLEEQGKTSINTTDEDSVNAKFRQGSHSAYNTQISVDEKHGLIVAAEAVSQNTDYHQLSRQVERCAEVLGHKPKQVCADAGYSDSEDMSKIDEEVTAIVPSIKQTFQERNPEECKKPFDKDRFIYDKDQDQYVCPEGKRLNYQGIAFDDPQKLIYQAKASDCRSCPHLGTCTTSKSGRKIIRLKFEDVKQRQEQIYLKEESQAIYKLRKQKVELPFGHIKHNRRFNQFLLRGRDKVNAEVSLVTTGFNITRMITIVGIVQLMKALNGV